MKSQKRSRILVVTACGREKHERPLPAYQLYKSTRIKAVYNRRMGHDMSILSAKYGLIDASKLIRPYDALMTKKQSKEFAKRIAKTVAQYTHVVYFRSGAKKEYLDCIEEACRYSERPLIVFGHAFMGGINNLPEILLAIDRSQLSKIPRFRAEVLTS